MVRDNRARQKERQVQSVPQVVGEGEWEGLEGGHILSGGGQRLCVLGYVVDIS